jgi:hypothetical protein
MATTDDESRNKKLAEAQQKIGALLAKEFPGERIAFWFFAAKSEGDNVKVSFSSKMNFDKAAPLTVWQAYVTGVSNHANALMNDFRPPELVLAPQKPVDRAMG